MRVQSEVPLGSEHNRPIDFEGKVEPFPPQGLFLVRQMTSRTLADGGEREVDYMFVHKAELSTDGNWKYSMWFQIWPGDVSATYTVTAIAPRAELAYLFQHHWDVRLSMDEMQREMEAEGCKTRRRYPRLPDEMARRFKKEDHKGQVTVALHRSGA